jgi:hypothetical protein
VAILIKLTVEINMRKETKEEFKARVEAGVAKAMRKRESLVEAGRKERKDAIKAAKKGTV